MIPLAIQAIIVASTVCGITVIRVKSYPFPLRLTSSPPLTRRRERQIFFIIVPQALGKAAVADPKKFLAIAHKTIIPIKGGICTVLIKAGIRLPFRQQNILPNSKPPRDITRTPATTETIIMIIRAPNYCPNV